MTLPTLLRDLLAHEVCPPLDRWMSTLARQHRWSLDAQQRLWSELRVAMVRASLLEPVGRLDDGGWPRFRQAAAPVLDQWVELCRAPLEGFAAEHGVPSWLAASWLDRTRRQSWTPAQTQALARAWEAPPPWHVRFPRHPEGQRARDLLDSQGLIRELSPGLWSFHGRGADLSSWLAKGAAVSQDASSQQCLDELDLAPGQRVWDVCAGRGGKTLLAADALQNKGGLFATDIVPAKLDLLRRRVRQSGWQNIRVLAWDGVVAPSWGPEVAKRGGFDRVIVDAPCTATGTWRRDPEARWRLSRSDLADLGVHQRRLLGLGWKALRPGGRLVYITCSWLADENEAVGDEFSAQIDVASYSRRLLGPPSGTGNFLYVEQWVKP